MELNKWNILNNKGKSSNKSENIFTIIEGRNLTDNKEAKASILRAKTISALGL